MLVIMRYLLFALLKWWRPAGMKIIPYSGGSSAIITLDAPNILGSFTTSVEITNICASQSQTISKQTVLIP